MRRVALACCLWWAGWVQAQPPVEPITRLDATLSEVRAQVAAISELLVGKRLTEPSHLHDLADIMGSIAVNLHAMATHAEHGQITAEQRRDLEAEIEKSRLMLEQLSSQIRAFALR